MQCYKCGISGTETRLYDAISQKGIVYLCHNCSIKEDIPLIKRPTTTQLKDSEEMIRPKPSFAKRETRSSGDSEFALRELVDRNLKEKYPETNEPRPYLVDNFHWEIMRARRQKHLTPEDLASEISESVSAIKMAEKGILPHDDFRLIRKIEGYFGINLRKLQSNTEPDLLIGSKKDELPDIIQKDLDEDKPVKFDSFTSKKVTIGDLKDIKGKKSFFGLNKKTSFEGSQKDIDEGFDKRYKDF